MNQICPKGYFWFKTETLNIAIKFCVFENWSNLDTKFQLKLTNFDFFGPTLPKRVFLFVNKINEHHYWVLYIEIGLTMKFQPKLTILIFWTKFAKKRNLRSKTEKSRFWVRPWSLLTILNFSTRGPTGPTIAEIINPRIFLPKFREEAMSPISDEIFPQ